MVLFIPVNIYLSTKSKELQRQKLKQQDSRIKITNEILNGVKVNQKRTTLFKIKQYLKEIKLGIETLRLGRNIEKAS